VTPANRKGPPNTTLATPDYQFRPVLAADLPLIEAWLRRPHVREWWGDPERGIATIAAHIDDPAIGLFIVSYGKVPIGYQQCWDPHAEPDHPCRDQPAGTRGIDQFIGEPDFLGYGHGSAFIRRFVEQLFAAGAPRVVTDPNPRNARAIRAYTKAGFRPIDTRLTISGQALLMACDIYTS
jgi:aminoglycoside 6'-N-acetyltransferase